MRLHGSLRKRARWKRTNPLLQKRLFCRCSKLRIFASTPFFVLSSGELSSMPWWHATFDEKHLSFPSLNVNTLTAWWASCATTATSKTLPIWARAMSTRATSLEHLLRSLAGQLLTSLYDLICISPFSYVYCLRSVPFIIAKMGRRWPLLFLFTCSGICGVVYGFIPDDLPR